jgi:hypothetical protein
LNRKTQSSLENDSRVQQAATKLQGTCQWPECISIHQNHSFCIQVSSHEIESLPNRKSPLLRRNDQKGTNEPTMRAITHRHAAPHGVENLSDVHSNYSRQRVCNNIQSIAIWSVIPGRRAAASPESITTVGNDA